MMRAARRAIVAVGRRLAALSPRAVLGLAWSAVLLYAFPGVMTTDSFDHLREARMGVYTDSHPPFIDLVWKLIDLVIAGPFGMLLLQSGLLLAGLYAIFRRTLDRRAAAWWAAGVFVSPPVVAVMAVIWKDCSMAGLLALGVAGLLSPRRAVRIAGLLALTATAAFRYNAFGATLPLVVLLFEWRPGMASLPRYAASIGVWLATTLAAFGINAALTDKQMHYWHSSLAIYDIVGTLARVDGSLSDTELRTELAGTDLLIDHDIHAAIRAVYTPRDFLPILNDPKHRLWNLPTEGFEPAPERQRDAIEREWWRVIERHPWAYARHRLAVMGEVLDVRTTHSIGAIAPRDFHDPGAAARFGVSSGWSPMQLKLTRALQWLARHTPLFVPWVYLVLTLILLPFTWRQRDLLALLLSGVGMEASLLPLVHSRDYRYSHWMVITTMVACISLAIRRRAASRRSDHTAAAGLLLAGDEPGVAAAGGRPHKAALMVDVIE
jgi:hypothetical protein